LVEFFVKTFRHDIFAGPSACGLLGAYLPMLDPIPFLVFVGFGFILCWMLAVGGRRSIWALGLGLGPVCDLLAAGCWDY
jgi:hypothetical protein